MSTIESSAFDPCLHAIGYALAQEYLATPDERARAVGVQLEVPAAGPVSPIDWFGAVDPVVVAEDDVEILKAS